MRTERITGDLSSSQIFASTATLPAEQVVPSRRSSTDSKIEGDLTQSILIRSASMSQKGSFRSEPIDLTGKVSEFPSPNDGIFTLPDQDKNRFELICMINELPNKAFFKSLKSRAGALYGEEIECLPPKKIKESLDGRLTQLYKECPLLKERAASYYKTIIQFFKHQTLPSTDEFEKIKSDFKRLGAEFADVQNWFKRELEPLRARVQKGQEVPLSEKQIDYFAYKLRSVLPREVIDACSSESDSKYLIRKKFLERIEKEWDETCLSLQKIDDYICVINNFMPVLLSLKSLREESSRLSNQILALRESSLEAPYDKLALQPLIKNNEHLMLQKDLADYIKDKKALDAKLLEFQIQKNPLHAAILQTLSSSALFVDGESIEEKAKELRPATFLKFMAFPESHEILAAKAEIMRSSDEEMLELSTMVVNLWNDISLDHFKAKQELLLTERIQDVCPQMDHIQWGIQTITTYMRNVRKDEVNYPTAVTKFNNIVKNYIKLSKCISEKNAYPLSREDDTLCKLGFKDLYEHVIEEIKSSVANLTTENATCSALPSSKIPESIASKYQFLCYNPNTDLVISSKFQKMCTGFVFTQTEILKKIQEKYKNLKDDSFKKAILELDRTFFAHKYIENNLLQLQDPRKAYTSETLAAGWKTAGYVHYVSPLD